MSEFLFAYGTLRPGLAPETMAVVVGRLLPVGEGRVGGVLYDLGKFPGAVLDAASSGRIVGTVYRLPEDGETLRALDAYEGFEPDCVEASLFVRVKSAVEMADGVTVPCWIYVYNRDTETLPAVNCWPS
jgi:gamma-glutamylcyclotransferase (GGCT)/AIG2-like uncharacterized protein YtfP